MNLFESLYRYRPREQTTPQENFLTSALACVLDREPEFCERLARRLGAVPTDSTVDSFKIEPHAPHSAPQGCGSTLYVDLRIEISCVDGAIYTLLVENKWDSSFGANQLENYALLDPGATLAAIVTKRQVAEARRCCRDRVLLWTDIADLMREGTLREAISGEFQEFLSVLFPLEPNKDGRVPIQRTRCLQIAAAQAQLLLASAWPWRQLPTPFAAPPRNQYKDWSPKNHRTGLIFCTGRVDRDPTLFVGFLTGPDFAPMCAGQGGIDLMLALWANPLARSPDGNLEVAARTLREKFQLATVLSRSQMTGQGGKWFRLSIRQAYLEPENEEPTPATSASPYEVLLAWMTQLIEVGPTLTRGW